MLCFEAYRFELLPRGEEERKMRQFAGSARYVCKRGPAIENDATGLDIEPGRLL
ncbi:MAG: hypothetical protein J2P13_12415 [Acidobacteria bacterium]|nr:hypothetical protein [Acidobacteriota bacterium]